MAQDTIDKIINIQFRYSDLIKGWEAASTAIDTAKAKLQKFKEAGDSEGVAKQAQIIKALRTEMSAYTREIQANIREEVKLNGSVENLRAGIQKLTAQYNKLGREERNNAKIGGELSAKIREMQTELNEANASLLNFRDNVGNYASAAKGFTPLAFQVQQLAREFPSLTISAQQFFLAISNNLPMLADELTRARMANKALRAEGKATIPVFRQVISSIFSWQTALVVGITLLTAYGKEIGTWVKGLFTAKEAALSMAEAQDKVNDALKKDGYGIGEQIAKVKELQIQWKALGDDLKARKQFIVDNKDAFDDLGVKVDSVNDAENLLVTNTGAFIDALSARARAAAGMKLAAEAYEKALIEQQKVDEEIKKGYVKVFVNEELTTIKRPYTDAEKEELMAPVRALEAQAEAYLNVSAESQKAASEILKNAGIEEAANDKVNKKVKKGITLAEQRAQAVKAARESIVKDITAIGNALDKELADAFKAGDSDITKGFKSQLEEQARKYQNRLTEATLSGGSLGAAKETIAIAKEQLAQLDDIASNEELINRLGWDDVELQRQRLDLRMQIAHAEQSIAREQDRTAQEAARQTAQTFGELSGMTGAFSAMFDALGGEGERYAEFAKTLAVFQVVLAQAEAIANAVASSAKAPWFMIPITIASSIATVVAAIAQATQITDSAETPKYASGGLVTGPGSGTSDSIPAMLSNGEAVMTAQAVNDWGAMLSAMNVASGGNAIQVSNLPQRNDGMKGMERMMERALMNMPAPIVSVVDINKGQKRVKVQNSLGKLGRKKYK
jgi:hypothetical protein